MGEIFRAKYAGLAGFERPCAIKRILPHLSDDEEFADRLINEAKIAVQLSHGNIVQIYELGKIESEYFIAMEWVDGPDLSTLQVRARAKDLPMPVALAVHVIHEVARALDHAHRKADAEGRPLGIVHRDVSPQNVMLSIDGAVKLGDFGIARAGGIARKFATGMGAVLGKRRYMSPEQRRGDPVDSRTDIYALGALLYEVITGEPPDPDSPAPPLATRVPDLPEELDELCASALEPDPAKRMREATALVEGLERVFLRMAALPGAIRDPSLELGRYVQRVCPPGEKRPQRRSLTARMRDAMRPGLQQKGDVIPQRDAVDPEPSSRAETAMGPAPHPEETVDFEARAAPEETISGRFAEAEPVEPEPPEPPRAAKDGGGVTLVISTVMAPPQRRNLSSAETIIGPRVEPPTESGAGATAGVETDVGAPFFAETQLGPRAPKPVTGGGRAVRIAPPKTPARGLSWEDDGMEVAVRKPDRRAQFALLFVVGALGLAIAAVWNSQRGGDALPAPTPIAAETKPPRTPRATPTSAPTAAVVVATPAMIAPTPRPRPTRVATAATPRPRNTAAPKATPRATAAPPQPAAEATLQLGALPWANISVDGNPVGNLNKTLHVAPGPHRIVFDNPRLGLSRERNVVLRPNETLKVIVDFKSPE